MKHLSVGNVHGKNKLQQPSLGAHTSASWSIGMATEPFFQIQKSFCHGFTSVTKSFTVRSTVLEGQRTCCMPSQSAPSPKVLQLAHWLPEERVTGCCILEFFFATPTVPHLHIQTWWTSPTGTKSQGHMAQTATRSLLSSKPLLARAKLRPLAHRGCWCVAPARCLGRHHRLLRLSVIKRKDPPPRNLPDSSFTSCILLPRGTFKRIGSLPAIHQLRPFRSSTSITGHTCVRSRERGCKADMLAWFASSWTSHHELSWWLRI